MLTALPTRSDAEVWERSKDPDYEDRVEVWESPLLTGTSKGTIKENYVLEDPNISSFKDLTGYQPVVGTKTTTIELGNYTFQKFSGEISQRRRARILERRNKLYLAVLTALKQLNQTEVVRTEVDSEDILNFIFG
jgi:hypothetical protein